MELEKSKEVLKKELCNIRNLIEYYTFENLDYDKKHKMEDFEKAISTVLQALDNSIPKEKVEQYLREEQEKFNVYKKESKENENLKLGMWKHLGAKKYV